MLSLPYHEIVHRTLVRDDAHPLIRVLEIVVQPGDGVNVAALSLGCANAEAHRGVGGLLSVC